MKTKIGWRFAAAAITFLLLSSLAPSVVTAQTNVRRDLPATPSFVPAAVSTVINSNAVAVKNPAGPILYVSDIAWATHYLEHPQIIKDGSTYHMYFHVADALGYQIGHATASAITGPWTADATPTLERGAGGEWDDDYVATPYVMKVGSTYYMWYSGYDGAGNIKLGLATAASASGPFTKYGSNPLAGAAAWVGSVNLVSGTYYMLGGAEDGQSIWTASAPEGPWTYQNQPFGAGAAGTWNAVGSMGESGMVYVDGLFYMFFGGRNAYPDPPDQYNARPFNLGLAVSENTVTWYEYPDNPILMHGAVGEFDEFRLSEIGTYYEDGTFYVTYTGIGQDLPGWAVWSEAGLATVTFNDDTFPWWDTDWTEREVLFMNGSTLTTTLQEYPLRVELSAANFDFTEAQNNGEDIRFVDRHGTEPLDYEIEWWDNVGESAVIWVRVPEVDAASDIDYIYMYWGNGLAVDAQTPEDVWGDATVLNAADSLTRLNNVGTPITVWSGTSVAVDNADKVSGTGSIKDTIAAPVAGTEYATVFDQCVGAVGGIDLSFAKAYRGNNIDLWVKVDRDSTAFTWARLYARDLDGDYRYWNITFAANTWTEIIKDVQYGDGESGTAPDLMLIDTLEVNLKAADGVAFVTRIDEVEKRWGAVGVWHFNEMAGGTAADSTRYGNDGTLGAGASWNDYDIDFDHSVNGKVTVTDSNSIDIVNGATLTAWVNATGLDAGVFPQVIQKGADATYGLMVYASANHEVAAKVKTGGGIVTAYSTGATGLSAATWYDIGAVYNRSNIAVYRNGTAVTDGTFAQTGNLLVTTDDLTIGIRTDNYAPWDGIIDEPRVWGYARSADEFRADALNRLDTFIDHSDYINPTAAMTQSATTDISTAKATLNGNVTHIGTNNPTVTIYYGKTDGLTTPASWDETTAPTSPSQPQGIAAFSAVLSGLDYGTTYYWTAKASNTGGTAWTATGTFTTVSYTGLRSTAGILPVLVLLGFLLSSGLVFNFGFRQYRASNPQGGTLLLGIGLAIAAAGIALFPFVVSAVSGLMG